MAKKPPVKEGALQPSKSNPRKISERNADRLRDTMARLGDISGIVLNRATGTLIGGNQRTAVIGQAVPVVLERFDEPTPAGTVAVGYVDHNGERFTYREVQWTTEQEHEAVIAANVAAGDWDWNILDEGWTEDELIDFGLEDKRPTALRKTYDMANGKFDSKNIEYPITIILNREEYNQWLAIKRKIDKKADNDVFMAISQGFLDELNQPQ